jgi:hypothetical protein
LATSGGIAALPDAQLRGRRSKITSYLDSFGDVRVEDLGGGGSRRLLQFSLVAPGYPCSVEVTALYREYYRRNRAGLWDAAKYTYEYRDYVRNARLAYHLHDLGGRQLVAHAHCENEAEPEDEEAGHLRATEYDLVEANTLFMRLYAADAAPDCSAFLPLEIRRR